jgi:hypothetical protein
LEFKKYLEIGKFFCAVVPVLVGLSKVFGFLFVQGSKDSFGIALCTDSATESLHRRMCEDKSARGWINRMRPEIIPSAWSWA